MERLKFLIIGIVFLILSPLLFYRLFQSDSKKASSLFVVTTVSPLTNIVYNVGGKNITLYGIVPEGVDSHTFEPAPSDAKILSKADIVFLNGLHLETPIEKIAKTNAPKTALVVRLGDQTISEDEWIYDFSFPKEQGDPNPHLWMDPNNVKKYVQIIRDVFVSHDPKHKEEYEENTRKFMAKIDELDRAITRAIQTIPPENRKLLTYHDSFAYFAKRYGMTVIGAIQPSDFTEPNPKEVATLINQLRKENVPAIFGSEVFPSKVLNQIAKEGGAKVISTLRDDDLPGEGTEQNHTYIGMMIENMEKMVIPLGGSIESLRGLDPSNVVN
ncbi:zinc ABC transporter substrate-binding protein [Candidatus Gottesmanbacteria bacterium]|nr:zinc ABC transporter substrate-binding protein [Candidatus Gottesmanbacteria bacterium]